MSTIDSPVIGKYRELEAICQEYDPCCVNVAQLIAELISSRLPSVIVEHIGSTAVPGCCGKGVIDLMALYSEGELEQLKTLLDELGFQKQSTRDPFPESRPMRLGSVVYRGLEYRLHVHVIAADAEEARVLKKFRDRLREDVELREAYVASKREIIASGITDSVDYSNAKDEFIKGIISLNK